MSDFSATHSLARKLLFDMFCKTLHWSLLFPRIAPRSSWIPSDSGRSLSPRKCSDEKLGPLELRERTMQRTLEVGVGNVQRNGGRTRVAINEESEAGSRLVRRNRNRARANRELLPTLRNVASLSSEEN